MKKSELLTPAIIILKQTSVLSENRLPPIRGLCSRDISLEINSPEMAQSALANVMPRLESLLLDHTVASALGNDTTYSVFSIEDDLYEKTCRSHHQGH